MPTFVFLVNGSPVDSIRGADVNGLTAYVKKLSSQSSASATATSAHVVALPRTDSEMTTFLTKRKITIPPGSTHAELARLVAGAFTSAELKETLKAQGVDTRDCIEKSDFQTKMMALL